MRLADRLSGLLALALGLTVAAVSRTFPASPGQDIGPGLFPTIIGLALAALGLVLVAGDRRRGGGGWAALDDWAGRAPTRRSLAAIPVALVGWILLVGPLGFLIASVLMLALLMHAFGARRRLILPVSVVVTLVTHYAFYTLLRVPLPWGILQGVSW